MSQKQTPYFELRSGAVDLLLFIVKSTDLAAIDAELTRRFEATPAFFADDVVAIDVRRLPVQARISIAALVPLLERVKMRPVGVVADEAQEKWAVQGGLPLLEARDRRGARGDASADSQAESEAHSQADFSVEAMAGAGVTAGSSNEAAIVSPLSLAAAASEPRASYVEVIKPTMIIDKPLRSGQQVFSKGDLVILALVSYGAEVIAEGNIHIYAPLRGRALAGVHGNHGARIFCTCLEPELVSIAGIYRTTENPLPASVHGQSVQIWLDDEKLIIEPLRLK